MQPKGKVFCTKNSSAIHRKDDFYVSKSGFMSTKTRFFFNLIGKQINLTHRCDNFRLNRALNFTQKSVIFLNSALFDARDAAAPPLPQDKCLRVTRLVLSLSIYAHMCTRDRRARARRTLFWEREESKMGRQYLSCLVRQYIILLSQAFS